MNSQEAKEFLQENPTNYILKDNVVLSKSTDIPDDEKGFVPIVLIPELGKYFHVKVETLTVYTVDYDSEVTLSE